MTDERVSFLTEILNGIKIIKMNCWEAPFTQKAANLRKYMLFSKYPPKSHICDNLPTFLYKQIYII